MVGQGGESRVESDNPGVGGDDIVDNLCRVGLRGFVLGKWRWRASWGLSAGCEHKESGGSVTAVLIEHGNDVSSGGARVEDSMRGCSRDGTWGGASGCGGPSGGDTNTLSSSEFNGTPIRLNSLCGVCAETAAGSERSEMEVAGRLEAGNMVEEGWKRDDRSGEAAGDDGSRGRDFELRMDALRLIPNLRKLCRLQRRVKPSNKKINNEIEKLLYRINQFNS